MRLSCARRSVNRTFGSMEGHRALNLVNNAIRCQLAQPGLGGGEQKKKKGGGEGGGVVLGGG